MISGDLEPRGRVTIMLKDMVTACQLSQSVGVTVPITALATELFRLLVNQGHDNIDQGGLIRLYTDQPLTGE
jgi:3-hydroxyisobutyrate dehydrogenase-like beta-hydroxyacid dehydrogenase